MKMSKSNRSARKELQRLCGKGCFFKRAGCEKKIEKLGYIKTFKTFLKKMKYSGKKISYQLTYHHLKHRSEGGETTVENGAVIEEVAHQYMHSLPRDQEEVVNDMIREFKMGYGIVSGNGEYVDGGVISLDFNELGEDTIDIPLYSGLILDKDKPQYKKSKRQKREEKIANLKNPSRAKQKRETRELIEEDWENDNR